MTRVDALDRLFIVRWSPCASEPAKNPAIDLETRPARNDVNHSYPPYLLGFEAVGPAGLEPATYGLKVRSSTIELEARGSETTDNLGKNWGRRDPSPTVSQSRATSCETCPGSVTRVGQRTLGGGVLGPARHDFRRSAPV